MSSCAAVLIVHEMAIAHTSTVLGAHCALTTIRIVAKIKWNYVLNKRQHANSLLLIPLERFSPCWLPLFLLGEWARAITPPQVNRQEATARQSPSSKITQFTIDVDAKSYKYTYSHFCVVQLDGLLLLAFRLLFLVFLFFRNSSFFDLQVYDIKNHNNM